VPEPSPCKGGAGFASKLFTTINIAMASLASVLSTSKDEAHQRCRNEFERFFLFNQGLSIADGDLDEVLTHSRNSGVLSLFLRLRTAVLLVLSLYQTHLSQVVARQHDDLWTSLDTIEIILQEPQPEEPAKPDPLPESDDLEYDMTEIIEDIPAMLTIDSETECLTVGWLHTLEKGPRWSRGLTSQVIRAIDR
jgi:hypothetical protein